MDITIRRGDDYTFNITVKDSVGTPVDLSNATIWFTVRKSIPIKRLVDDLDAAISKKITSGGVSGVVSFDLTHEDTNIESSSYVYDIQYKDSLGKVHSSASGQFFVIADITRDS